MLGIKVPSTLNLKDKSQMAQNILLLCGTMTASGEILKFGCRLFLISSQFRILASPYATFSIASSQRHLAVSQIWLKYVVHDELLLWGDLFPTRPTINQQTTFCSIFPQCHECWMMLDANIWMHSTTKDSLTVLTLAYGQSLLYIQSPCWYIWLWCLALFGCALFHISQFWYCSFLSYFLLHCPFLVAIEYLVLPFHALHMSPLFNSFGVNVVDHHCFMLFCWCLFWVLQPSFCWLEGFFISFWFYSFFANQFVSSFDQDCIDLLDLVLQQLRIIVCEFAQRVATPTPNSVSGTLGIWHNWENFP